MPLCTPPPHKPPDGIQRTLTVPQLTHPNHPSHLLVKHLKAATVLLRLAGIPETARAVQDAREGFKVKVGAPDAQFEVADLGQRGVLAAGAEEVAEGGEGDEAGAALVEEGEGFFVVG